MAFVITGPRSEAIIEEPDQPLLHELPRRFGLHTPQCDMLWEAFYRDPRLPSPEQVSQLKAEIQAIRSAYEKSLKETLVREKKIHARSHTILDQLLAPMLALDPVLTKCDEIVRVCDEAILEEKGLSCSGD